VRYLGLSEVNADQLRRAHGVHPIAAVESEYSLWTREVEVVAPVMAELGISLVGYAPLGRGFLTGTLDVTALGSEDFRSRNPRFQGEGGRANLRIVEVVRAVADRLEVAPAQVALSWVYTQEDRLGVTIVAIPGTKKPERGEQNVAALDIVLDAEALADLDPLGDMVVGERYGPGSVGGSRAGAGRTAAA